MSHPDAQYARATREDVGAIAPAPLTRLQQRIKDALEQASLNRQEGIRNNPTDMPEVDREITMLEGALEGINQRLGELTAAVQGVLDPLALESMLQSSPRSFPEPEQRLRTETGGRLRRIQHSMADIEMALAFLANGVQL